MWKYICRMFLFLCWHRVHTVAYCPKRYFSRLFCQWIFYWRSVHAVISICVKLLVLQIFICKKNNKNNIIIQRVVLFGHIIKSMMTSRVNFFIKSRACKKTGVVSVCCKYIKHVSILTDLCRFMFSNLPTSLPCNFDVRGPGTIGYYKVWCLFRFQGNAAMQRWLQRDLG